MQAIWSTIRYYIFSVFSMHSSYNVQKGLDMPRYLGMLQENCVSFKKSTKEAYKLKESSLYLPAHALIQD